MRVIVTKDYEEMSLRAAEIIKAQILLKPNSILGLATGSTPIGTYQNLVKYHKEEGLDFSNITTVNLDEYKGLAPDHDQSYRYFMNHNLFNHVNINKDNTNVPNGLAGNDIDECMRYDELIESLGRQDLQLLGLGNNGHIGFNEPAESFSNGTYCVTLTDSTIDANSRFFESRDDVPKYAYTMGAGTIMRSKRILLVASGKAKAEAIKAMVKGPVSPKCPASVLQLHGDCIIVIDSEAASLL